MKFNQKLKYLMNQQNITQKELSQLTGIGKTSISQYVNGRNEPSKVNRERIEDVLGEFKGVDQSNDEESERNVPVSVAAQKLGKSEQFIRVGLQRGILDFGFAVKTSSRYSYHISPKKFEEYIGG